MFVAERRRAIIDQLKQQGRVSVKSLSEALNVSEVTIRQDLRALEESGLLERTYGGAVARINATESPLFASELSFEVRQSEASSAKAAIGAAAAALVKDGYGVALDASTTAAALVPHLKRFAKLTIVTNSLIVAQRFLDSPHIQVLMPGGRLRRDSISLVGKPEGLPEINLNIGFFGTRGLSAAGGATDSDPDEVLMKRAMIDRCMEVVIVADSSKWGQVAPYTFARVNEIDRVITTDGGPQDTLLIYGEGGVAIEVAAPH